MNHRGEVGVEGNSLGERKHVPAFIASASFLIGRNVCSSEDGVLPSLRRRDIAANQSICVNPSILCCAVLGCKEKKTKSTVRSTRTLAIWLALRVDIDIDILRVLACCHSSHLQLCTCFVTAELPFQSTLSAVTTDELRHLYNARQ